MAYEVCRHIKTNGRRCQAPAITGEIWCYFHDRFHTTHGNIRRHKVRGRDPRVPPVLLPMMEDRDAIQLGISLVLTSLETGIIGDERARTLFRGLELASKNVAAMTPPIPTFELPLSSFISGEFGDGLAEPRMSNDRHLNGPADSDRHPGVIGLGSNSRGCLSPPPVPSDDDEVL